MHSRLGCSSSESNTLSVVSDLIETVEDARRDIGNGPVEYQVYLNDLPKNDFNTIFQSLSSFKDKLKQQLGDDFGHCFVNGVPGSFYGRLFPSNHLHFVHSSYSLHWLSQVCMMFHSFLKRCLHAKSMNKCVQIYDSCLSNR